MDQQKTIFHKTQELNQDACWQAVLSRDQEYDHSFVYAVRSTGIYCRPSCPSRRPRREQVTFFSTPQAAGEAGFRPCLRCRPEAQDPQAQLVQQACRIIEQHDFSRPLTLSTLGARLHLDPRHLQKTFKKLLGISPRQYMDNCRLNRLKTLVKTGNKVTEALYQAGYNSSSRFYAQAPSRLGMTPRHYLQGGRGMKIGYAIADSPLGRLLVAATGQGICAVSLGESDAALVDLLVQEYPAAQIQPDQARLGRFVDAILQYLSGWQPHPDLPLDLRLTAFQQTVFEELRRIPWGSTRSYQEIARAIGRPRASRAVGRACSSNPVALLIPCHRVLRQDGSLGGYRWGINRKEQLLALEKKTPEGESKVAKALEDSDIGESYNSMEGISSPSTTDPNGKSRKP